MGRILMLAVCLIAFSTLSGCGEGSKDPVPQANPAPPPAKESLQQSSPDEKSAIGVN